MKRFNKVIAKIVLMSMLTPVLVCILTVISSVDVKAAPDGPYYSGNDSVFSGWNDMSYDTNIRYLDEYTFVCPDLESNKWHWSFSKPDGEPNKIAGNSEHLIFGTSAGGGNNWKMDELRSSFTSALNTTGELNARGKYLRILESASIGGNIIDLTSSNGIFHGTLDNYQWGSNNDAIVYSEAYCTDSNKGLIYYGCDYNRTYSCFMYYVIAMGSKWGDGDSFSTLVFASQKYYDIQLKDKSAMINLGSGTSDNRVDSICSLISNELVMLNDSTIFVEAARGNDEYRNRFDRINDLILVDNIIDNTSFEANIRLPFGISIDFSKPSEGLKVTSSTQEETLAETNSVFSFDKVDWKYGDTGALTRPDSMFGVALTGTSNSIDHRLALMGADMICDTINCGYDGITGMIESNISHFGGEADFTYLLFSQYIGDIAEAAKQSSIIRNTQDGWFTEGRTTNFDIVQAILQTHVEYIGRNEKFPFDTMVWSDSAHTRRIAIRRDGSNFSGNLRCDCTLSDLWNELSAYQQYVLKREYELKLKDLKYIGTVFDFFKNMKSTGSPNLMSEFSSSELISHVQDELLRYDESDFRNTGYAITIARVCGLLSKYTVLRGLYSDAGADASDDDVYNLYNAELESFLSGTFSYDTGEDDLEPINGWLSYMPSRIGIFGENGIEPYLLNGDNGKSWDDVVVLLYNVEYAFEVMSESTFGDKNGLTLKSMEAFLTSEDGYHTFSWLSESEGLSQYEAAGIVPNFNNDSRSLNMFRSIIELHDMCEFMRISGQDWSPVIKAYLDFYNKYEKFFNMLRNDPQIYTRIGQGVNSVSEPLGVFFSLDGKKMSDQWAKGFANSALFVPMETNVYDANTVTFIGDTEWVSSFFYRYGFYRKALYINTDNSAIVNEFVSGEKSGVRVATLSDLLNYDRDIILTVDDNFYNAGQISSVIDKIDYTPVRGADGSADAATGWDAVKNWAGDLIDIDAQSVLKTGEVTQYSKTIATSVWPLTASADDKRDITKWKPLDSYVMSTDEILGTAPDKNGVSKEAALDAYDYSVKVPYAIVSAIYRSDDLYNECLRCSVSDTAIFKSSKAICSTPGSSASDWRALYNYYMLANLERQMKNDASSTLDINSPIFCDIFGNIITESGIVIIPAACNATLCGSNWTPYTVGWSEYYNNGNHIKVDEYNSDVLEWLLGRKLSDGDAESPVNIREANKQTDKTNAGGYFWTSNGEMVLRTTELSSGNLTGTVQFDVLNKNSSVVKQLFWNDSYYNKAAKMYGHTLTNLVIETMRGAPIEFIDYEYEGLDGNLNISKYGVYMAYKLEELANALVSGTNGNALGGNAVITMPNLAFVDGVEYIMLYAFKIVFAIMVVGLGVSLYFDAVKNSLGIKSVVRFVATCMATIIAITLVPNLISWTYYGANKALLADEAGSIMTLNYVKEYDGAEIGITSVSTPETNTKLYLKVNNVDVPWWKIIPEVLFGHTFSTVSDMYQDALKEDAMANNPMVEMKSDGLYVDVQDIFDSTAVQFTPSTNMISSFSRKNQVNVRYITVEEEVMDDDGNMKVVEVQKPITYGKDTTSVVSFTCPYYVILDQLVASINEYNVSRDISAYSWSVGSNGNILTYDVISPYLTSTEFLEEGFDILGLEHILGVPAARELYNFPFDDTDISQMSASRWYCSNVPMNVVQSRIDHVNEYARNYVIKNQDTLGKVPDEVFLKVMAMQIAIEYNKEFNISQGNAIEIVNVDTRDLMRFMVAPKASIYKNYSYSFARYVYESSGTIGVVLSAILLVVYWITSFIKPLVMLIILGLLVVNVVFRKVLFRRESRCIEGYLIGCACLCLCNYAYALMLKLSMSVADIGLGSVTALICAVIVQVFYVMSLLFIIRVEMKDWQNSGFNEFANIGGHVVSDLISARTFVVEKILSRNNEAYNSTSGSRKYASEEYNTDSISAMLDRDREREERGSYNPN